jgi:hypothetical protein
MGAPLELGSAETLVSRRRSTRLLERLAQGAELDQGPALGDLPAGCDPGLEDHSLVLLEGRRKAAGDDVHAVPDFVVEGVRGDDRVALGKSLVEALVEQGELPGGPVVSDGDEAERPQALEVGSRLLGDLHGALRCRVALGVVELERVDPCDPKVGKRKLGGGTLSLERLSRALVLLHRVSALVDLPLAAAQVDPSARRLQFQPELVELRNTLGEELLGGGRLTVVPAEAADPAEQQCSLARIGNVGQDAFEQLRRFPECD